MVEKGRLAGDGKDGGRRLHKAQKGGVIVYNKERKREGSKEYEYYCHAVGTYVYLPFLPCL